MKPTQLIKIRKALNLTQAKLGLDLGVDRLHVLAMEHGNKKIMRITELALQLLLIRKFGVQKSTEILNEIGYVL